METRFLANFGDVRVHTGADAARSASQMNAAAYTRGQNIVFAPGRFAPGTPSGDRLIAHELAHVIQQSQPRGRALKQVDTKGDPEEQQAEQAANRLRWGSLVQQYDKVAPARSYSSYRQAEKPFSDAVPSRAFIQRIQLTYDDGPDAAGNTRKVLDELNKAGARATFYLVGKRVAQGDNWRVVFDIAASGHFLGNHAFDWNDDKDNHIFLNGTPRERADKILETELAIRTALITGRNKAVLDNSWLSIPKANRDEIEEIIAHGTGRFRTPGFKSKSFDSDGAKTAAAIANANNVLSAVGLRPFERTMEGILGSEGVDVDPKDWEKGRSKPEIELAVHDALKKNTDSVLLHSRVAATAAATPGVVADIKDRKFTFDPTPQGAVGSITPKSGFAHLTISDPPTSAGVAKAKEFFRAGNPSRGGNIFGGMAVRIFQLAQRVGRAEVDAFAAEIRTAAVQTKDGPVPLANWMDANDEWNSFAFFFQAWNTMDTGLPAPYPMEVLFEQNRPLESQAFSDLSVLTAEGNKTLTALASLLKGDTGLKVELVGSCSSEGSVEENYKLGERRSRFVFAQVSIPANRLFDPSKDDLRSECHHISPGIVTCGKAGASDAPNPKQRRVLARFYR
jgi:peptidoglycan/xylan/chitin deacetylase (PgdA/CDA1 family)